MSIRRIFRLLFIGLAAMQTYRAMRDLQARVHDVHQRHGGQMPLRMALPGVIRSDLPGTLPIEQLDSAPALH